MKKIKYNYLYLDYIPYQYHIDGLNNILNKEYPHIKGVNKNRLKKAIKYHGHFKRGIKFKTSKDIINILECFYKKDFNNSKLAKELYKIDKKFNKDFAKLFF